MTGIILTIRNSLNLLFIKIRGGFFKFLYHTKTIFVPRIFPKKKLRDSDLDFENFPIGDGPSQSHRHLKMFKNNKNGRNH